jgi:hypothetical protein
LHSVDVFGGELLHSLVVAFDSATVSRPSDVAQPNHRVHERYHIRIVGYPRHDRSVDLQYVDRDLSEIT